MNKNGMAKNFGTQSRIPRIENKQTNIEINTKGLG